MNSYSLLGLENHHIGHPEKDPDRCTAATYLGVIRLYCDDTHTATQPSENATSDRRSVIVRGRVLRGIEMRP